MSVLAQALHILRKDVRRFWPFLILSAAVLAMGALSISEGPLKALFSPISLFGLGGLPLILGVLAAVVIHEDPLVGDKAFWTTRPISSAALLLAKAWFIGLFLFLLPLAVHAWMLSGYTSTTPLPRLVLEAAVSYGSLLALLCLAASLTADLKSWLVLLIAGGIGLGLVLGIATARGGPPGVWDDGIRATWGFIRNVAGLGLFAVLMGHQFLTRNRWRTLVLGGLAFVGIALWGNVSTVDWSHDPVGPSARWTVGQPEEFELGLVRLTHEPGGQGSVPSGKEGIEAQINLDGPEGLVARQTDVRLWLLGPGYELEVHPSDASSNTDLASASQGLDGFRWIGGDPKTRPTSLIFTAVSGPEAELEEIRARANDLRVSASFDVFKPTILGRLPLVPGASIQTDFGKFSLPEVTLARNSVVLEVQKETVNSVLTTHTFGFRGWSEVVLALVNSQRGEVFPLGYNSGGARSGGILLLPGPTVALRTMHADFNGGTISMMSREPGTIPSGWINGAELLIIGTEYVGSVDQELLVEDVPWPKHFESWFKPRSTSQVRGGP